MMVGPLLLFIAYLEHNSLSNIMTSGFVFTAQLAVYHAFPDCLRRTYLFRIHNGSLKCVQQKIVF